MNSSGNCDIMFSVEVDMLSGKLSDKELTENVLKIIKRRRKEVLVGAGIGLDCAELDMSGKLLITSDPITASCSDAGVLAVDINANDIYASFGEPLALELIILAPVNASLDDIKKIVFDAERRAEELNIEIVGGHTEFTDAVNRMVVCVTMVGIKKSSTATRQPKIGDSIVMTKYAAIETSIILSGKLSLDEMKDFLNNKDIAELALFRDMLSIKKEAEILAEENIGIMHDITEGGVLNAVNEMCRGGNFGCKIDESKIPVKDVSLKLCDKFNIDFKKSVSSGSVLFTASEPNNVIKRLEKEGINATKIGEIIPEEILSKSDSGDKIIQSEKDEIFKIK